jgi:hypothetical protein
VALASITQIGPGWRLEGRPDGSIGITPIGAAGAPIAPSGVPCGFARHAKEERE